MTRASTIEMTIAVTGLSDEDFLALHQVKAQAETWREDIVKSVYDVLYATESTRATLEASPRERSHMESTLGALYDRILSGSSSGLLDHMWVVGLIHIMVNVGNDQVIAMATRLVTEFVSRCAALPTEVGGPAAAGFTRVIGAATAVIAGSYDEGMREGLIKVGMNEALIQRVRSVQVKKMLEEARGS